MDEIYPGPCCKEFQVTGEDLKIGRINHSIGPLTNGFLLEVNAYLEKQGQSSKEVFNIAVQIDPSLKATTAKYVKTKLSRLSEQKKRLTSKKKVSGYKNVNDLLNGRFQLSAQAKDNNNSNRNVDNSQQEAADLASTIVQIQNVSLHEDQERKTVGVQTNWEDHCDDINKHTNLAQFNITKLKKLSNKLDKKIEEQKNKIDELTNRIGHYSVRNVNKRDENAKKNTRSLRESQRLAAKLDLQMKKLSIKLKDAEVNAKKTEREVQSLNEEIQAQKEKGDELQKKVDLEKAKKVNVQKLNSYFKNEVNNMRKKLFDGNDSDKNEENGSCLSCDDLVNKVKVLELEICEKNEKNSEKQSDNLQTKSDHKSFNDNVRLCVVELSGLEVAVEKIPEVIRTVSKHLYKKEFDKKDLPTSSTVQSIIDEGHFLAKTFLSQKLDDAESWGINRDGTTRRKQKLLDTAVTLDSGQVMSLGFNRVAHETAVTIHDVTKSHLKELADMNTQLHQDKSSVPDSDSYIKQSLEKLAFTMSDRASNEKKANVILNEWRDEVLSEKSGSDSVKVNSFHCMAHVLLGFHSYICKDMKEHEKSLSNEHGPLGRDSLSYFKFWNKKNTVVERVARTTSNVFGPSGDHHGARDKWEAHCAANGIKSTIGNYKDNRFNGLFQTAAEICLHREDFIKVLETINSPNLLLKSVLADLQSDTVMALLQAIGLFYVCVTGPYWNLVVGSKVPYLELHTEIAQIMCYLEEIDRDPATLLQTSHWSDTDTHEISHVPYKEALSKKLSVVNEDTRQILYETIILTSRGIRRTIEKQLVDFLPGGQYSKKATEKELKRTGFAHVTNLACEHHFGSLDSSQRRRPHASLHHHSSVQLIKQNRTEMITWLTEMPDSKRNNLLKSARKGGRDLRKKHQQQEAAVLTEITAEMYKKKTSKKRKAETDMPNKEKRQQCDDLDSDNYSDCEEEARLLEELPSSTDLSKNDYVAVAYQDNWYPGVVTEVEDSSKVVVRFLAHTNKPGVFKWPARDDIQIVENRFIIVSGFIPDCAGSGRMWVIEKYQSIDNLFNRYAKLYF